MNRQPAVAGTWYPSAAPDLRGELESYLLRADRAAQARTTPAGELVGLIAPHAGLMYSGPVAAHAYRLLRGGAFDLVVLVGPSHFVPFHGVSVWADGTFETPFGAFPIDRQAAVALLNSSSRVQELPRAHEREHSLEMQLPFLGLFTPEVPILPLVMGQQTRDTVFALADALADLLRGRRALLVASSDLSHYKDAPTAARLDAKVIEHVQAFDADGLMALLERKPEHACGGGPMVTVLRASRALGATASQVLHYGDSGDVSGDKHAVVGYMAAALWRTI